MEIDNEEFISCILSKPALWDSKNVHHKNKKICNKFWEEIKRHFGNVEISILKKRWKNLKDQYRKELKKLPMPRSGDPGHNVQSSWQFFSQMNFLRFEILPDDSDTNLNIQNNEDSQLTNTIPFSMSSSSTESAITETDANLRSPLDTVNILQPSIDDDENTTKNIESSTNSTLSMNTSTSSPRPRKRKTTNDIRIEMLELEKKRLLLLEKDLQKNTSTTQASENKSEDYYYLMSLLPQMESFTPLQKFNVRNRINQVMMEEIQNAMFGDPSSGSTSTSRTHEFSTHGTPE